MIVGGETLSANQETIFDVSAASTLHFEVNGRKQYVIPVPYIQLHQNSHKFPKGFSEKDRYDLAKRISTYGYGISTFKGKGFVIHPKQFDDPEELNRILVETAEGQVLNCFQELEKTRQVEFFNLGNKLGCYIMPTYLNAGFPDQNFVVMEDFDVTGEERELGVMWLTPRQMELFEQVSTTNFYLDTKTMNGSKLQDVVNSLNMALASCSKLADRLTFAAVEPAGYSLTHYGGESKAVVKFGDYQRREKVILDWLESIYPLGHAFNFFQEPNNSFIEQVTGFLDAYKITVGGNAEDFNRKKAAGLYVFVIDFTKAADEKSLPFWYDAKSPMAICMEGRTDTLYNKRILFEVSTEVANLLRRTLIDTDTLYLDEVNFEDGTKAYKKLFNLREKMRARGLAIKPKGKKASLPIPTELIPSHIKMRMGLLRKQS